MSDLSTLILQMRCVADIDAIGRELLYGLIVRVVDGKKGRQRPHLYTNRQHGIIWFRTSIKYSK
jgi:hypothetical protein